jgi:outer membrane protein assembly factor BamB
MPLWRYRTEAFFIVVLSFAACTGDTGPCVGGEASDSNAKVAADWPQFRGPDGQGHSAARNLPLTWSETANVAWKVAVPGLGWSSPVIQGEQIWLTTALDNGRSLRALCLERATGKLLHDIELFAPQKPGPIHSKNSHASPTPIIEGGRVYVHFGQQGTGCLTTDGKVVWKATLPHQLQYGSSSTPILFEDLLIVHCDGIDVRYTAALDKATGKVRWKAPRDGRNSESTPLVIAAPGGPQLISNVAERVVAYDPRTGKELWSVSQGNNFAQTPRPVYGHGLVFVCGGYFSPLVQAIRPDGRGDVTKTHVAWTLKQAVPLTPSPLLVGNELYLVSDDGVASCVDARTGTLHWRERLGGKFSASPVFAAGRIYFLNEEGVTTVVAPTTQFKKLATNKIDGRTLASPAVAGRAIYLRTDQHLYRIEDKSRAAGQEPAAPPVYTPARADEPFAGELSLADWQQQNRCSQCHANFMYTKQNLPSNSGTAFALLALEACGAIPKAVNAAKP